MEEENKKENQFIFNGTCFLTIEELREYMNNWNHKEVDEESLQYMLHEFSANILLNSFAGFKITNDMVNVVLKNAFIEIIRKTPNTKLKK